MIGKVKLTSISYGQFCGKLRKLCDGVTDKQLYREWCRALTIQGNDYEKIAKRINKQNKVPHA